MQRRTNTLHLPPHDNRQAVILFARARATLFYPGAGRKGGLR